MGQTTRRPVTFDHLRKKEPLERSIRIVLSDEAAENYAAAQAAADKAELAKAEAALESASVTLRFRSIGRKRYEGLVRDHPPTDEQLAEAKEAGDAPPPYDAERFCVSLIAASCVEPEMTKAQVEQLSEEWNAAEYMQLWVSALEVNTQRRVVELGKGSNGTRS